MTGELTMGGTTAAGLTAGRGRGPGGQPMAVLQPVGLCPVAGCGDRIDRSRLMCRRHWYLVPRELRGRVWATWRSGDGAQGAEHQEAVLMAIAACHEALARRDGPSALRKQAATRPGITARGRGRNPNFAAPEKFL